MLCLIKMNRYGHLEVEPKSEAESQRLRAAYAAVHNHSRAYRHRADEPLFYIQDESSIEVFLNDVLGTKRSSAAKRRDLAAGYEITKQVDTDYLHYLLGLS